MGVKLCTFARSQSSSLLGKLGLEASSEGPLGRGKAGSGPKLVRARPSSPGSRLASEEHCEELKA